MHRTVRLFLTAVALAVIFGLVLLWKFLLVLDDPRDREDIDLHSFWNAWLTELRTGE